MKKFLIAGSSLAAVGVAGAAGAVDVTLGGSIDMGVEFGIGKSKNDLAVGEAYNSISLSIAAAGTTDGGMRYGGSFTLATAAELEFNAYDTNGTEADGKKALVKMTVAGATDIEAAAYNVSGGQMLAAKSIVGVKINSDWMSVGDTATGYALSDGDLSITNAKDICKVAGIAAGLDPDGDGFLVAEGDGTDVDIPVAGKVTRLTVDGEAADPADEVDIASGYLPAGKIVADDSVNFAVSGVLVGGRALDSANENDGVVDLRAREDVTVYATAFNEATADGDKAVEGADLGNFVAGADVYAGPFMEVKLASSSTKMVVGAVCVEGVDGSATNYFMDNASKVVTASDASIYIEGGFGKITLQTGDFAGGVSAIGSAGDAADLEVTGLGVIVEGVGMLGANPFIAVDLANQSNPANLSILTGGTMDLGGLSAAVDVAVNSSDVVDITSWDLGLSYAMGDMNVAFAYDSENDWGLSASMAVAGFAVDATFASDTAGHHEKSGITYAVNASTSLNGFGLSLGVDQDMKPTVGLSKSMGGLSLYAGYDAADNGGAIGATLSF